MEVHFVHKNTKGSGLGVLGVFMLAGERNASFSSIVQAMPKQAGTEVAAGQGADPPGLVPNSLGYWRYEGSLTTLPCDEVVDSFVCRDPIPVALADIERFKALYPMNARPSQGVNRRFVLRSS